MIHMCTGPGAVFFTCLLLLVLLWVAYPSHLNLKKKYPHPPHPKKKRKKKKRKKKDSCNFRLSSALTLGYIK